MATFRLTVEMDNEAFTDDPGPELARILFEVRRKVANGHTDGVIMDVNGNKVGRFETED